ncbi:biotin--[acetyl-CoA-carboxylase] synthetase [Nocardia seriolae]|uniref:biotin--[biotin carboxyl-carrier protein] ligase n=1 Tax=Nocardia seriolae TaxID=37332 RepID=A0ABC9YM79_9NOCA|nr:biotin--[acetyl-CoA-carboxylase] ligase [Nocardia seriolae]BEK93379.1 biotin--[acetyl-CoA-carboxylase] ligase [Nocardia seriolae]GAM46292.1 biotin--acetyl-CoA-carboxylase ligase [Nocardia seriolae]GAP26168.1 biotin--[acetyl-CoA-carboxylase] synthetase [Nocardia seriolae]GEM21974.1 putative biotin--acetyl-CoA-carboxylase ligase (BirA bifunctional protein) [Nocardia seriolae NBRC 15557]
MPLDADLLARSVREVPGLGFFSAVEVVESTGSTNADLVARAADSSADRLVLIAETQERGRGRHDRQWVSPPRAQLAMSLLVRVRGIDPAALGWLPLLTGVAVVDAVRAATGVKAVLKWPNDVLVEGRKLSGILAEIAATGTDPAVVVGVGLNVSLTEAELPVPHATSLLLSGVDDPDRTALVIAILREFSGRFAAWEAANWDIADISAVYRDRCSTIRSEVRAELPGGEVITGVATGIDENGRLLIGDRAVSAGDVTHLRAEY